MTDETATTPRPSVPLWHIIEIGYEHDIEIIDGVETLVYRVADDLESLVPRRHKIRAVFPFDTVNRALARMQSLAQELPDEMTDAEANWHLLVEFVGQLVGRDTLRDILDDPTSTYEEKLEAVATIVTKADIGHLLGIDLSDMVPPEEDTPGE